MKYIVITATWMCLSIVFVAVLLRRQWLIHNMSGRHCVFSWPVVLSVTIGMVPTWLALSIAIGKATGVLEANLHDILMTSWKNFVFLICQTMGAWWGILRISDAPAQHRLALFFWPAVGALFAFSISIFFYLLSGVAMYLV